MAFTENEFFVGMIAYFTVDQLRAAVNLRGTGGSPNASPRPFVAYAQAEAGDTYWTALSTQQTQSERTPIETQWIRNATGRFRTDPVVVNDDRHTYAGSVADFAALSTAHDQFAAANRQNITTEGVTAVCQVILPCRASSPTTACSGRRCAPPLMLGVWIAQSTEQKVTRRCATA